jgi:drug/metabolite transporter (DMT)-like permease
LAFTFAATLALASGVKLVWWRPRTLWLRSLSGSVSLVCSFYAMTHMPVADVLTLTNMFPIWVALLSWPMFGEAPPGYVWIAVAGGVIGVVLIQEPQLDEGSFTTLIALASSFTTALAMIGLHRLHGIDPRAVVVHFSAVSMFFCVAALLVSRPQDTEWSAAVSGGPLLMLVGVGLTATIGQLFLTKAFAAGPPAQVSVVGLSQIIFALLLEVVCFHRELNAKMLLGMALVIGPTAWVTLRTAPKETPPVA